MKLEIRFRHGLKAVDHRLELQSTTNGSRTSGKFDFQLDGGAVAQSADYAEIAPDVYSIIVDGLSYQVHLERQEPSSGRAQSPVAVRIGERKYQVEVIDPRKRRRAETESNQEGLREIRAPMPGRIVKILVEEDQEVAAGEGLLIIEAMKMQNEIRSPGAGRVGRLYVDEGCGVETGERLVRLVGPSSPRFRTAGS